MWSRKHSESLIDGGRGIGASNRARAAGTVAAGERCASSPACRNPSVPRAIRSSSVTPEPIA